MNIEADGPKHASQAELFDDILLSLNLSAGLLAAGLFFVLLSATSITNIDDSGYFALRAVYRVSDILRLSSVTPVSTATGRRELPGQAEHLAVEITLLVVSLAVAGFILLVWRLVYWMRADSRLLGFMRLPVMLFAGPAFFLFVAWRTRSWVTWGRLDPSRNLATGDLLHLIFIAEFLCLGLTLLRPNRRPGIWAIVSVTVIHWTFWCYVIWKASQMWFTPIYVGDFLLVLLAGTTLLWVWRANPLLDRLERMLYRSRNLLYSLSVAAILLGVALWHPARNVALSHPRDWKTVAVAVSRGPCFGSCAVYTMTVRGDGRVEYVGRERHARIDTRKMGTIGEEKILEILRYLDQVEFTVLDDRAFRWSFDTASIGVRAIVDGKTKEVMSDYDNQSAGEGRQARFLDAAGKIDAILRSTTWTECEGECWR